MLNLFKKKKEEEVKEAPASENADSSGDDSDDDENKSSHTEEAPNANLTKLSTEVDRMKVAVESFGEVRKSLTERISGISEQIGELRAMILDRDRAIREIELKAIKAADLVEAVQPEKLMISLQKQDAKFEALKANLEGNESIMERIMEELKEMRRKLEFFRDIDETIKLSEEVRKELIEIKRVEANVHINADKVDTIYSESRKKYQEIDIFNESVQELKVSAEQNSKDIEVIKTRITGLADKDELEKLIAKFQKYVETLKDLNRTSALSKDVSELKQMLEMLK